MTYKLELEPEDLETLDYLVDNYYFGLFREIVSNEDEEYKIRDVLEKIYNQVSNNEYQASLFKD